MTPKTYLASSMGFCQGVKRAVEMAEKELSMESSLYSLGALVHNKDLLDKLAEQGMEVLSSNEVPQGSKVLIRAHGVTPEVEEELKEKGCQLLDGTCPKVKASQLWVKKYSDQGYQIIIAGDRGHGEVLGLRGYAKEVQVIASANEVSQMEFPEKVLLISQTTFSSEEFQKIAQAIEPMVPQLVIKNTLCPATEERQQALKSLIPQVEGIIIVGGKNSANTYRLFETAQKSQKPCWLVERANDLDNQELGKLHSIGISAGASTPDFVIQEIIQRLESL